jgi:hypothetical protein
LKEQDNWFARSLGFTLADFKVSKPGYLAKFTVFPEGCVFHRANLSIPHGQLKARTAHLRWRGFRADVKM